MKVRLYIFMIPLVLFAPSHYAGEFFKCTGEDGAITFSDSPCSENPDNVEILADPASRLNILPSHPSGGDSQHSYSRKFDEYNSKAGPHSGNGNTQSNPHDYVEIPPKPIKPKEPWEEDDDWREEREYKAARSAYLKKVAEREAAIDAEKRKAVAQNRKASQQYCDIMRSRIEESNQLRKSLNASIEQAQHSRPPSRASVEQRSNFHKSQVSNRERFTASQKRNAKNYQEYSKNLRDLCR